MNGIAEALPNTRTVMEEQNKRSIRKGSSR
jgi:hypothetical protein